jgi:hypothetical protein
MKMAGTQSSGRAYFATAEQEGIRWDAAQRLGELIERREALLADADDPEAMSELTAIASEMAGRALPQLPRFSSITGDLIGAPPRRT